MDGTIGTRTSGRNEEVAVLTAIAIVLSSLTISNLSLVPRFYLAAAAR